MYKKIVNKLGKYDVEFGPSEDYDLGQNLHLTGITQIL